MPTEVLVHLYEERGAGFLPDLDGMFAFVIWVARRRRALLARDRFGVKPLYMAKTAEGFAFASETKALAAAGWIDAMLDPSALPHYFRFAWVPEPHTLWRGVTRLAAGCSIEVVDGVVGKPLRYHRHSISTAARHRQIDDGTTLAMVEAAVKRQLVADVPVGLFLSGGLDSSLIAATARRIGTALPCHTIAFRSADRDSDPNGGRRGARLSPRG